MVSCLSIQKYRARQDSKKLQIIKGDRVEPDNWQDMICLIKPIFKMLADA